jgi:hypothetical protein
VENVLTLRMIALGLGVLTDNALKQGFKQAAPAAPA